MTDEEVKQSQDPAPEGEAPEDEAARISELERRLARQDEALASASARATELEQALAQSEAALKAGNDSLAEAVASYQRFSVWGNNLAIISGPEPDGSQCAVYYGVPHTIDAAGSTLPTKYHDLVAIGACSYAAVSLAAATVNKVNVGGKAASEEYRTWGNERLVIFRERLRQLGRRQRVRSQQLFKG